MKKYYQRFLQGHAPMIHLAAHSHHFWPDISFDGHNQYWLESSRLSDRKWDSFLGEHLQQTQSLIAGILNFDRPGDIAFAPNTHELLFRLLSCLLPQQKKIQVLTTDCEFHSFSRQLLRLEQAQMAQATRLSPEHTDFAQRLLKLAPQADVIFLSHVFFNTGLVLDLKLIEEIIAIAPEHTIICVDGYHGFCALPTDISKFSDRVFYLAGGYKYAQAGEGMCFMTVPKNCQLTPLYTGWFADFARPENSAAKQIGFASDGFRFWGATEDLSAHFRFKAIWNKFSAEQISVQSIHSKVRELQQYFVNRFECAENFISTDLEQLGHFLTLQFPTSELCAEAHQWLHSKQVLTDFRGKNLRFGFAPYLDKADLDRALTQLNTQDFRQMLKK